jgi:hypothetical protein
MSSRIRSLRQIFIGRDVGIVFGILIAGSLLIGAFLPWYLAVLFASSLRNVYLHQLGSGLLFDSVAVLILYVQAVLLTAIYRMSRFLYQKLRQRRMNVGSV